MNNKIIWIAGSSAAGKETFIKYIVEQQPKEIVKRLGWEGLDIIYSQESIDHVVQGEGDGNKEKRESLADDIIKQSQKLENTIVLVKWQDLDYDNKHLLQINDTLPNDTTEIIFLHTDLETIYQRVQNKVWWSEEYMDLKDAKYYIEKQIDYIKEYQDNGIFVRSLESDDSQLYLERSFPPDIESDFRELLEKIKN